MITANLIPTINNITVPLSVGAVPNPVPMSASIPTPQYKKYQGDYAVTPTEQSQTLATKDRVMEQDVVVNPIPEGYIRPSGSKAIEISENGDHAEDVTNYASVAIHTNVPVPTGYADVRGVTALANDVRKNKVIVGADGQPITGSYLWSYVGDDAEFMQKVYDESFTLANTTYSSWTASTTAKAIKATATAGTFVADMANYDYIIRWKTEFDAEYADGATLKVIPYRECNIIYQALFRRPNSIATITAKNFLANTCATLFTAPLMTYYGSGGSLTYGFSASYGFYAAATAATFSSATADNPTVTIKTPTFNARCSTTYFATGRKDDIKSTSPFHIVGELFRAKQGAVTRKMFEEIVDLFDS